SVGVSDHLFFFFFFSSRRRHTRFDCDWSSDVCSSDLLDALLITWLVLVTGNVYSPYSALYIVVISVASIFVGARGGLLTSVGCASCYTAAMLALTAGWLGDHGKYMPTASTASAVEAVGLHDVAFLVVGLLSARLAERQTRSE